MGSGPSHLAFQGSASQTSLKHFSLEMPTAYNIINISYCIWVLMISLPLNIVFGLSCHTLWNPTIFGEESNIHVILWNIKNNSTALGKMLLIRKLTLPCKEQFLISKLTLLLCSCLPKPAFFPASLISTVIGVGETKCT